MPHIRAIPGQDYGYDASRKLQVVPVGMEVSLLLVAGPDLTPYTGDDSIVTVVGSDDFGEKSNPGLTAWERDNVIQRIRLRGKKRGETYLAAKLGYDGPDWTERLRLVATEDYQCRQVNGRTHPPQAIVEDCYQLSLRDAVLRVAADQLNSGLRKSHAGAEYGASSGEMWCGIFAFWCWQEAATIKAMANPFGRDVNVLRSPQKGICWACAHPDKARLVNITETGAAHVAGFAKPPKTIPLLEPSASTPVLPGDIMFQRHATKDDHFRTWKHIGLVTSVITSPSDDFTTLEGNTADVGRENSINEFTHSLTETAKVAGKIVPRYGFLSLTAY